MNEIVVQCNVQNVYSVGNLRVKFSATIDGNNPLPFTTPFTEGDQDHYDFLSSWEGVECTVRTSGTAVYPIWKSLLNGVEMPLTVGYEVSDSPDSPWNPANLSSASSTINWT